VAVGTTLVAAALSYALPEAHAATGVGLCFLAVVYLAVLYRGDAATIREFGLGLGGLFEPVPIEASRVLKDFASALAWALGLALLVFPLFWLGYLFWYRPVAPFEVGHLRSLVAEMPGQVLGIAFPEEAFYRGYLQSALDRALPPERRVLGARVGVGLLISSALFAVGHFLTEPLPTRLAVFFPSLAFGWLRSRSGGIGAALAFHAFCNLFASYLGRSYGLFR
jgi:membrane protease YdiL (CAAX protease family)